MSISRKTLGFTLIEVLLYIAVSAGIALGVISLLRFIVESNARYAVVEGSVQEAHWVAQRIVDLVHGAGGIVLPESGQTAGAIVLSDGTTVGRDNQRVFINRPSGQSFLTSSRVEIRSLLFSRSAAIDGADIVRVEFIAAASGGAVLPTLDYEKTYTTSSAPLR